MGSGACCVQGNGHSYALLHVCRTHLVFTYVMMFLGVQRPLVVQRIVILCYLCQELVACTGYALAAAALAGTVCIFPDEHLHIAKVAIGKSNMPPSANESASS